MQSAYMSDPYYAQYNDPRDLYQYHFNQSQIRQQNRLAGGSWSQPCWNGWKPIIGAGKVGAGSYFQRYAQDGDSGFFHSGLFGRGMPIGMNPNELNHLETEENYERYDDPRESTIEPTVITEPSPQPLPEDLEIETAYNAEPEQKALYVPPYSQTINQGMGHAVKEEDNVLYQEPFEIKEYKGTLHKKKGLKK